MYQEILKKKQELDRQKPLFPEVRSRISKDIRLDMLHGDLLLEGAGLKRNDIEEMLQGTLVKTASLGEYTFVQNYSEVLNLIQDWIALGNQIDKKFLLKAHSILAGKTTQFRRSNPAIDRYGYVPIHPSKIEEQVSDLLRQVYKQDQNVIVNAAHLHCDILRIYPFENFNEAIARITMNYYLMEKGFLPVLLGFGEDEYVKTMRSCLHDKNEGLFVRGLERAVYNKLDVALQIVADLSADI